MSPKLKRIFDNSLFLLRIVDYESRLIEGVFVMSVEPIKEVIRLWETGQITIEQCLGKILLLLLQFERRLLKLEATNRNSENN